MVNFSEITLNNFSKYHFCDINIFNNKLIALPKQKDIECGIQIMNVIFDTGNYDINIDINIVKMNVYLKIFEIIEDKNVIKNPIKEFKLENGKKTYNFNSPNKTKYNIKIICKNIVDVNNIKNFTNETRGKASSLKGINPLETQIQNSYFELNNFNIHHHIINDILQTIDISESILPNIINNNKDIIKNIKPLDNIKINMNNINSKLLDLQNNLLINNKNNNSINKENNNIYNNQHTITINNIDNNDNIIIKKNKENINKITLTTEFKENDVDYDNYIDPKEILNIKSQTNYKQNNNNLNLINNEDLKGKETSLNDSIKSKNENKNIISINNLQSKTIKYYGNNKKTKQLMTSRLQSKIQTQQPIDHHYILNINDKLMNYSSKFSQGEIYNPNKYDNNYILRSHLELLEYIYNNTPHNIILISENISLPSINFNYNLFKQFNSFDMILLTCFIPNNKQINKPILLSNNEDIKYISNTYKCYPGAYIIKRNHIPILTKLIYNKLKEIEFNNIKFEDYELFNDIITLNNLNYKYYIYDNLFKSYNLIENYNSNFNPYLSIIIFNDNNNNLIEMINKILNYNTDIKNYEFIILSNNIDILQNEILKRINYCIINYENNNYVKNYNIGIKYSKGLYITFLYSSWNINNIFNFNKLLLNDNKNDIQIIAYPFKIENEIYNPIIKYNEINNIQVFIMNKFIKNDYSNIIKFNEQDEYPLNDIILQYNLFNNIIIGEDIYECNNIICKIHNQKEIQDIYNNLVEQEIKEEKDVNINNISLIEKSTINYQSEIINNSINIKELKHKLTIDINNKINNFIDLSKDTLIFISSQNIIEYDRQFNILYSLSDVLNIIYIVDTNIKSTDIDIKYNMLFMTNYIFNKIHDSVFINKVIIYFNDYNKYPIVETLIKDYTIFEVNDTIFYNNYYNNIDDIDNKLFTSLTNSNLVIYSSKLFEPLINKYCKNKTLLVNNVNINYNINDINYDIINEDNDYKKIKELKETNTIILGFVGYINQYIDFSLLNKILDDKDFRYKIHIVMIGGYNNKSYNLFDKLNINISNDTYNLSFNTSYNNISWIPKKSPFIIDKFIELFDICILPFKITQIKNNFTNPIFLYKSMLLNKPILSTINYNDDFKLNIINKDNYDTILNNIIQIIKCQIEIDYNKIVKSNIYDIYNIIQDQYNVYLNDNQINTSCALITNDNILNNYNMNKLIQILDKYHIKYNKYNSFNKVNDKFIICNIINDIDIKELENINNLIIYDSFNNYLELFNNDNILFLLINSILILTDNKEFINFVKCNYPNIYKKTQYITVEYNYNYINNNDISIIINDNLNNLEYINKILDKFNKKLKLQDINYNVNIYSNNNIINDIKNFINNDNFNYLDYNIDNIIQIKNNKVILIGEFPLGNFIYEKLSFYNTIFTFNYMNVFNTGYINYECYIYNLLVDIGLLTNIKLISESNLYDNYYKEINKEYILDNFDKYWKNLNISRGYSQTSQSNIIDKDITHLLLTKEEFDNIKVSKLYENINFKLCIITNSPSLNYSSLIIQEIMKFINCDVYVYNSDSLDNYTNFIYNNIFDKDELVKVINDNNYDFILYFNLPFDIENVIININKPSACFKLNVLINNNTKHYITNSYFISNYIMNNTDNKIIPFNVNYNIPNINILSNNKNIFNINDIKIGCLVGYLIQNEDNIKNSYNNGLDIYLKTLSRLNKNNYNIDVNILGYNCYNKNENTINKLCNLLNITCNYYDTPNYNELLKLINDFDIIIIPDKNIDFNFNLFTTLLLNKIVIVPNTPLYIEFNKQYYDRMNKYNKNIIIYKNGDINSLKNSILEARELLINNNNNENYDYIEMKEYINKYYNNQLVISNLINAILELI